MSETSDLAPSQVSTPNPVLIMAAVLTTYQAFVGGLAALEVLDPKLVGVLVLAGAAVGLGWGVYTRGQVTPWSVVVAKATPQGNVIAGPAAMQDTGASVVVTDAGTGDVVAPPADSGKDEFGRTDTDAAVRVAVLIAAVLVIVVILMRLF